MYNIFLTVHSYLRWVVLILALAAIVKGLIGLSSKSKFVEGDRKVGLFFMISCHTQLLIGLILYVFLSPITQSAFQDFGAAMKNAGLRFFAVEHILTNIIAVVLVTIGHSKNKKGISSASKHKNAVIFYGLGLIFILSRIPWDRLF